MLAAAGTAVLGQSSQAAEVLKRGWQQTPCLRPWEKEMQTVWALRPPPTPTPERPSVPGELVYRPQLPARGCALWCEQEGRVTGAPGNDGTGSQTCVREPLPPAPAGSAYTAYARDAGLTLSGQLQRSLVTGFFSKIFLAILFLR